MQSTGTQDLDCDHCGRTTYWCHCDTRPVSATAKARAEAIAFLASIGLTPRRGPAGGGGMRDDCVSPSGQPAECGRSRCVVGACHPPTEPVQCMFVADYTSDHDEFLMRHAEHEGTHRSEPLP